MKPQTEELFKTSDLHLGAYLHASGMSLIRMDGISSGRKYFLFSDKTVCEALEASYWSGKGEVSAKRFSDSIKTLRAWIFSKD